MSGLNRWAKRLPQQYGVTSVLVADGEVRPIPPGHVAVVLTREQAELCVEGLMRLYAFSEERRANVNAAIAAIKSALAAKGGDRGE